MDSYKSQQLAKLLGSVSISELLDAPYLQPEGKACYLTYTSTDDIKRTTDIDIYNYLTYRIFFMLAANGTTTSTANLNGLYDIVNNLDGDTTPISFARWLCADTRYKEWLRVDDTVISDYFLPEFQYYYFDNLSKSCRTMLLKYESNAPYSTNYTLKNNMWDTHLEIESSGLILPKIKTDAVANTGSAITFDQATDMVNESGYKFKRRNYAKITYGDVTKTNSYDVLWCSNGMDNNPSGTVGRTGKEERKGVLGDIDSTLQAIDAFLDDVKKYMDSKLQPFRGMVGITTNRETGTNDKFQGWNNSLFNDRFIRAAGFNDSVSTSSGSNDQDIGNIPEHDHGHSTTVQNISIIGQPEGETIGGYAVSDRLVRDSKTTSTGLYADAKQDIVSASYKLTSTGPYSGRVRYPNDPQGQKRHNNVPLYYKVRICIKE